MKNNTIGVFTSLAPKQHAPNSRDSFTNDIKGNTHTNRLHGNSKWRPSYMQLGFPPKKNESTAVQIFSERFVVV